MMIRCLLKNTRIFQAKQRMAVVKGTPRLMLHSGRKRVFHKTNKKPDDLH